ncbi:TRAP transporter large permease subunit [Bradyrhizobium sp. CCBAU 51765]|uniref:TRAP transporter large permease subunit n=1 Tax=Bradyrhizobium sp. CCBAU 51765 TaxID=1325102 RepID=UPI001FEF9D0B|nr:TRAP transporter large permease subunit [Bradyrhizobium sp. CCBAU 51765]
MDPLFLLMFLGLLCAGIPIFLVLGLCAAVLFGFSGQPVVAIAQKIADEMNSSTLMALPLFVMAAAFMRRGGVAKALVDVVVPSAGSGPPSAGSRPASPAWPPW